MVMDEIELKNLWQAYDQKLEKSLSLNLHIIQELQKQKASSALRPLKAYNLLMVGLGIIWISILCFLVSHAFTYQKIFFAVSVGAIILFNVFAIIIYIYHIVLIRQVDNSDTVIGAQKKLATLQASTIKTVRILFLQTPFYGTFFYSPAMLASTGVVGWLVIISITGLLVGISIWLYRNIDYKNMHKKWFKRLFSGWEWNGVIKARTFLDEIAEFERM